MREQLEAHPLFAEVSKEELERDCPEYRRLALKLEPEDDAGTAAGS